MALKSLISWPLFVAMWWFVVINVAIVMQSHGGGGGGGGTVMVAALTSASPGPRARLPDGDWEHDGNSTTNDNSTPSFESSEDDADEKKEEKHIEHVDRAAAAIASTSFALGLVNIALTLFVGYRAGVFLRRGDANNINNPFLDGWAME